MLCSARLCDCIGQCHGRLRRTRHLTCDVTYIISSLRSWTADSCVGFNPVQVSHQADETAVVLEPVVGHGAQFSCVVLDTPRGPVALPPTEMGAYDLEHDVLEAHLDMERRQARFEVRQESLMVEVMQHRSVSMSFSLTSSRWRG